MEMYSDDWDGQFPDDLSKLTPKYLKTIPTCPSAGRDTYTDSLRPGPEGYTVCCQGKNHEGAGLHQPNFPTYDNVKGLTERP